MTREEIVKHREALRKKLAEVDETSLLQYEQLTEMLLHLDDKTPNELDWLLRKSHDDAFTFALTEHGTWMKRKDLLARLQRGGYIDDTKARYWAVNAALGHHLPTKSNLEKDRNKRKKYRFLIQNEEAEQDAWIGLAGRDDPKKLPK